MSTGDLKDDLSALSYDYQTKIKKYIEKYESIKGNKRMEEKYGDLIYRYRAAQNALSKLFCMHYDDKISLYNDYDGVPLDV